MDGSRCGTIGGTAIVASPFQLFASRIAFALWNPADCAIHKPLQRRRMKQAVDPVVLLCLTFGCVDFSPGQIVGKARAALSALPFVRLLRRVAPTPV